MKRNHFLWAATALALAPLPLSRALADEEGGAPAPDFGLDPNRAAEVEESPAPAASKAPEIRIAIDGKELRFDGQQLEAMVGQVLKNLSSDGAEGARDALANLLGGADPAKFGVELGDLFRNLPRVEGEGSARFEVGDGPMPHFEAKAFVIGPDGEKREIQIDSAQLWPQWVHGSAPRKRITEDPYYIGVAVEPAPEALRGHLGLPENAGLVVISVYDGSPAESAGLLVHDVVLKAAGMALESQEQLVATVQTAGDADTDLVIEIVRGGKPQTVAIKPAKRELPPVTSGLFVPKIAPDPNAGEEIRALRDEMKETRALLAKILERLDKIEAARD